MKSFYHVWFSTKGRKPVLQGEIDDEVKQLLIDTATEHGIELVEVESAFDHIHMLLAVNEGQNLSSIMHQLKGASSRYISLGHPEIKFDMGASSFWQKSYGSRAIAASEVPTVRRYIQTQGDRPHRHHV